MSKTKSPPQSAFQILATDVAGTPFENVRFQFVRVTPQLAQDWLARNKRNRKPKPDTVTGYARDMRNGEWVTNHQGGAFFADGDLMDFQHRLMAVVESQQTVMMVVSTGWPKKLPKQKACMMDAVDIGRVRSLRDQLELQHGIANAADVVKLSGALAALCCGMEKIGKNSPGTVLAIAEIYAPEFKWMAENIARAHGLRIVSSSAVIMLGLAAWPEPTRKFYEQLKTGLNLTEKHAVYPLRNFLLSLRSGNNYDDKRMAALATAHHLKAFVEGKPCGSLVSQSKAALGQLLALQGDRAKRVAALFGVTPPVLAEDRPVDNKSAGPASPEALAIGQSLRPPWSASDLAARLDGGSRRVGAWLADWKQRGWIEPVGFGQYRVTEKFGK
ncbi:MAG: hypothetical protein FD161_3022 [Limisphaerales bacterium]|nr:MAG: hypothetical protein FD161_3022 [Limisphaerales bacterium]KAG0508135.1 MAG: hypothetical protein E1N63_2729 [Limisphaerales bacterium]TXT53012.1 MAG: hypothetical protein FD140_120 [Limisphaerales bacterium]